MFGTQVGRVFGSSAGNRSGCGNWVATMVDVFADDATLSKARMPHTA